MKKLKKIAIFVCIIFACNVLMSSVQNWSPTPPVITWYAYDMKCTVGHPVKITVGIMENSTVDVEIRWNDKFIDRDLTIVKNGKPFYKYESYYYKDECGLHIADVKKSDAGEYSFTFTNSWGQKQAKTLLYVYERG